MESSVTIDKPSFSLPQSVRPDGPAQPATDYNALQSVAVGRAEAALLGSAQSVAACPHSAIAGSAIRAAVDRTAAYRSASLADSSKRAYRADLAHFIGWGGAIPSTPELIARYCADHGETLSSFTLNRRLVAIGKAHRAQCFENPCATEQVRAVLRGIRRVHGAAQRQVDPLLREELLAIIDSLPATTKGMRDRALLLVGFAAALRRSELVALTVADVRFGSEGLTIRLRRSKTDQEAEGRDIGVPFGRTRACPVKALRAWLDHAGITTGPILRSVAKGGRIQPEAMTAQSVALVVKSRAARIGLDPKRFSGHSLRAGLLTSAAKLGVSAHKLRQQSGHRSDAMVARYVRDGELFVGNAAGAVL